MAVVWGRGFKCAVDFVLAVASTGDRSMWIWVSVETEKARRWWGEKAHRGRILSGERALVFER